jgi:hypothetical protein
VVLINSFQRRNGLSFSCKSQSIHFIFLRNAALHRCHALLASLCQTAASFERKITPIKVHQVLVQNKHHSGKNLPFATIFLEKIGKNGSLIAIFNCFDEVYQDMSREEGRSGTHFSLSFQTRNMRSRRSCTVSDARPDATASSRETERYN